MTETQQFMVIVLGYLTLIVVVALVCSTVQVYIKHRYTDEEDEEDGAEEVVHGGTIHFPPR